jgi:hypothetical protein
MEMKKAEESYNYELSFVPPNSPREINILAEHSFGINVHLKSKNCSCVMQERALKAVKGHVH